eukprot:TRINITY_DN2838_c0_g2_i4.p1 TRINITY_DN2838_c0_g2~~TRINITY_DN2838_c0_g2_i4.p1  ORF type:complete len:292 (+),score=58.19 TRINITY_DN2838_c0_g2_i4:73-948(+)
MCIRDRYMRAIEAVQLAFLEELRRLTKNKFITCMKRLLDLDMLYEAFGAKLNDLFSQLDKNKIFELINENKAVKTYIGDLLVRTLLLSKKVSKTWKEDKADITEREWKEIAKRLTINIEIHYTKKNLQPTIYQSKGESVLKQPLKLLMSKNSIGILYTKSQALDAEKRNESEENKEDDAAYENYIDFILDMSTDLIKSLKKDVDDMKSAREKLAEASGSSYSNMKKDLTIKVKKVGNRFAQYQSTYVVNIDFYTRFVVESSDEVYQLDCKHIFNRDSLEQYFLHYDIPIEL